MRAILGLGVIIVLVLIAGLWMGLLRVDQTQQAQLPKVSVSGGRLLVCATQRTTSRSSRQ